MPSTAADTGEKKENICQLFYLTIADEAANVAQNEYMKSQNKFYVFSKHCKQKNEYEKEKPKIL